MGFCCLMFYAFKLTDYYPAMATLMLYPWAVIPSTYALSFFFTKEWSAQLVTVILNISVMMLYPIIVVLLSFFSQTSSIADIMNSYGRILPMYNVSKSLVFCGFSITLQRFRKSNNQPLMDVNPWSIANIEGDCLASIVHFFVSFILIFLLEGIVFLPVW